MKLVFLFRRLVFAQVMLGIVAFCIAERNPGVLLIAGALTVLSWYVVEGPNGKPLPQWVIHLGAFGAVALLLTDLSMQPRNRINILIPMGHFTMWLQIIQLYGRKSNREYGLVLVLSLLQMVGASILTVSMIFGLLLAAYCVLALFTVLVFQLKATSDLVMSANLSSAPLGVPVGRPQPAAGRGRRWQFRATASAIGLWCALVASVLFVVLPRTSRFGGSRLMAGTMVQSQIGYSTEVRLDGPPPGAGSREPVLHLKVSLHGRNAGGEHAVWHLRGSPLDHYSPSKRLWSRRRPVPPELTVPADGLSFAQVSESAPMFDVDITVRKGGHMTLFTLYPFTELSSSSMAKVRYDVVDQKLEPVGPSVGAQVYHLKTPLDPQVDPYETSQRLAQWNIFRNPLPRIRIQGGGPVDPTFYARGWTVDLSRIQQETLRILHERGLDRDINAPSHANDQQIAEALADYLRTNYAYSLNNPAPGPDEEPISTFLFELRQGHCELFASALAAMTRSIGMQTRVVTGYLASEYNRLGGYYVVRESHAHAWNEVRCGDRGWVTIDATPPDDVAAEHHGDRSMASSVRELYEYMEFWWIRSFVTYDKETRDKVLNDIRQSFSNRGDDGSLLKRATAWLMNLPRSLMAQSGAMVLTALALAVLITGAAAGLAWLVRRRRRISALRLTGLSTSDQRDLARRLRFYITMSDLLAADGHARPKCQTPLEFAESVHDTDGERYGPVVALTRHFYEIRFGRRSPSARQRADIREQLDQLTRNLASPNGNGANGNGHGRRSPK